MNENRRSAIAGNLPKPRVSLPAPTVIASRASTPDRDWPCALRESFAPFAVKRLFSAARPGAMTMTRSHMKLNLVPSVVESFF
jgi:hypothetical protein